jgi:hypothetical protein
MERLLTVSPFIITLVLGLALGVTAMVRGIDRHLARRGHVSPLNLPTIAACLTVAGAVGYPLARYSRLGTVWVMVIAAGSGLVGAVGVFALIAGWIVPSAAHDVEDERFRLQGHLGRVTSPIRAGEAGVISYEHEGESKTIAARGLDDKPIEQGAEVVIERIENGTAYVELWSTIAQDLKLPV